MLRAWATLISHFHYKSAFKDVNITALIDLCDIKWEHQQFPSRGADVKVVIVICHRCSPRSISKMGSLSLLQKSIFSYQKACSWYRLRARLRIPAHSGTTEDTTFPPTCITADSQRAGEWGIIPQGFHSFSDLRAGLVIAIRTENSSLV